MTEDIILYQFSRSKVERGITEDVVQLIIHEFGHNESLDHLSSEYHEALCRIGANMFELGRRGEL